MTVASSRLASALRPVNLIGKATMKFTTRKRALSRRSVMTGIATLATAPPTGLDRPMPRL